MKWLNTEEEIEKVIEDMVNRTKGAYITQGVSFNKSCPRQMGLLKMALMSSQSFSGLIKELLAVKQGESLSPFLKNSHIPESKSKNIGNFL